MRVSALLLTISFVVTALCTSSAYGGTPVSPNRTKEAPDDALSAKDDKVSSAQRGVHLLEHILQRMRNLPQLALSKTKQSIAFQSQAAAPTCKPALADTNLLIKPKGLPRALPAAPAIAGLPLLTASNTGGKVTDAIAPNNSLTTGAENDSTAPVIWERQAIRQAMTDEVSCAKLSPGIGNVKEYAFDARTGNSPKEEQEKRIVSTAPLITEFQVPSCDAGNLGPAKLAAKKEKAKLASSAAQNEPQTSSQDQVTAFTGAGAIPPQMAPNGTCPSRGLQRLARTLAGANLHGTISHGNYSSEFALNYRGSPSDRLLSPKVAFKPADSQGTWFNNPKAVAQFQLAPNARRREDLEIALSPPTIITGITLVRLGNSEKEAAQAVASIGDTDKDSIHGWSVWSVHKHNCPNCSIQVFLKHGVVEAIRIFDPSLLRPELGVTLGDCLSSVKEKFGEPAFILAEPASLMTQNYIYPISQIGFQLARTKQDEVPKIVSMIVFNVR